MALTDYISSAYQAASNQLKSQKEPKEIIAFVEAQSDVPFWYNFFGCYDNENIKISIQPYSREKKHKTGKKNLIKAIKEQELGDYLIVCMDSDYDYALSNHCNYEDCLGKSIIENNYIFHTYAYSVENLKCYHGQLTNICVKSSCTTDDETKTASQWLLNYSRLIYNLLTVNMFFYKSITHRHFFTIEDFSDTVSFDTGFKKDSNINDHLEQLRIRINKKLLSLEEAYPEFLIGLSSFRDELREHIELCEDNAYLFMNGHTLFYGVTGLLKFITSKIRNDHREYLKESSSNSSEELKNYQNLCKTKNIDFLLSENYEYKNENGLLVKIKEDVENFIRLHPIMNNAQVSLAFED